VVAEGGDNVEWSGLRASGVDSPLSRDEHVRRTPISGDQYANSDRGQPAVQPDRDDLGCGFRRPRNFRGGSSHLASGQKKPSLKRGSLVEPTDLQTQRAGSAS
jgi:hypothetical protein